MESCIMSNQTEQLNSLAIKAIKQTTPETIQEICSAYEQLFALSDEQLFAVQDHVESLERVAIKNELDPNAIVVVAIACTLARLNAEKITAEHVKPDPLITPELMAKIQQDYSDGVLSDEY